MKLIYNPIGLWTLMKREVHRFMKVYIQTIVSPLISNLLYLAIFGGTLASRHVMMGKVGYLSFLVPGLCVMGAIFAAFQNPSFSLVSHKFQNTIYDFNAYPLSDLEKCFGFVFGGTVRGLIIGVVTYIATIPFVGAHIAHPIGFLISLIAVGIAFSSFGVMVGLRVTTFEGTNFIFSILLTPITYLSGIFFQVSSLPGVLSTIAYLNPLFPLVSLVRYTYLGVGEGSFLFNLIYALIVVVTLFLGAYMMLKKGVGIKN